MGAKNRFQEGYGRGEITLSAEDVAGAASLGTAVRKKESGQEAPTEHHIFKPLIKKGREAALAVFAEELEKPKKLKKGQPLTPGSTKPAFLRIAPSGEQLSVNLHKVETNEKGNRLITGDLIVEDFTVEGNRSIPTGAWFHGLGGMPIPPSFAVTSAKNQWAYTISPIAQLREEGKLTAEDGVALITGGIEEFSKILGNINRSEVTRDPRFEPMQLDTISDTLWNKMKRLCEERNGQILHLDPWTPFIPNHHKDIKDPHILIARGRGQFNNAQSLNRINSTATKGIVSLGRTDKEELKTIPNLGTIGSGKSGDGCTTIYEHTGSTGRYPKAAFVPTTRTEVLAIPMRSDDETLAMLVLKELQTKGQMMAVQIAEQSEALGYTSIDSQWQDALRANIASASKWVGNLFA